MTILAITFFLQTETSVKKTMVVVLMVVKILMEVSIVYVQRVIISFHLARIAPVCIPIIYYKSAGIAPQGGTQLIPSPLAYIAYAGIPYATVFTTIACMSHLNAVCFLYTRLFQSITLASSVFSK